MYTWDDIQQIKTTLEPALVAFLDGHDDDLGQLPRSSIEAFLVAYLRQYQAVEAHTPATLGIPVIDTDDTTYFYLKFSTDYMLCMAVNQTVRRSLRPDYLQITHDIVTGVGSCAISLPTP